MARGVLLGTYSWALVFANCILQQPTFVPACVTVFALVTIHVPAHTLSFRHATFLGAVIACEAPSRVCCTRAYRATTQRGFQRVFLAHLSGVGLMIHESAA